MMILPLAPFLIFGDASPPEPLHPTGEAPIVFQIADEKAGHHRARFEICFDNVASISVSAPDRFGELTLNIGLNENGTMELARATTANVGAKADLLFEGEAILSPIIQEPILSGNFQISGLETIEHAEQLRQALLGRCTPAKDETE